MQPNISCFNPGSPGPISNASTQTTASASLTAVRKCSVWNFGEIFFFLIFQIHPKPRVSVSSMGLRICTHEARPYDETLSAHALGGKAAELTRAHSGG
jgi:hypothetical protein